MPTVLTRDGATNLIRPCTEKNGVISFTKPLISSHTPGKRLVKRLRKKGIEVSDTAESVLHSRDFKFTDYQPFEFSILRGSLFCDSKRMTSTIREEAIGRRFGRPEAEAACILIERVTPEELTALEIPAIVVMHVPIMALGGIPSLLTICCGKEIVLDTCDGGPGVEFPEKYGFLYLRPPTLPVIHIVPLRT
jgi:hypothetical protein